MKSIRRFQRTMIVALVGLNILVFSSSFYGNLSSAFGHAFLGMAITGTVLISFGLFRKTKIGKKSMQRILPSRENS